MRALETTRTIDIYFHDRNINWLFSELLSSLKINNRVLSEESDIFESEYVITEPKYFNLIRNTPKKKCILVGDYSRINKEDAIHLSQPLTESKILAAISMLVDTGAYHRLQ